MVGLVAFSICYGGTGDRWRARHQRLTLAIVWRTIFCLSVW